MNPRKKPKFLRQMHEAYKRIGTSWRKPKGKQSKARTREKGKIKLPNIGYRAPKELRYLHPSDVVEVLIHNLKDLEKVNPQMQAVKIAHAVGKKKRSEILKKAGELKIKVLNP